VTGRDAAPMSLQTLKTSFLTGTVGNDTNKTRDFEEIPDEIEESEEYHDDDFEQSDGSAELAKVSVSQSGRLPPLSGSYPHGGTNKSFN